MLGRHCAASEQILSMSNGLKMIGITAPAVSTKMIELHILWYWTYAYGVKEAMGPPYLISKGKQAIALFILTSSPLPTASHISPSSPSYQDILVCA